MASLITLISRLRTSAYMARGYRLFGSSVDISSRLAEARKLAEDKNFQAAMELLTPLANDGEPGAQLELGVIYAFAQNPQRNLKMSYKLFESAANQGLLHARYNLAQATEYGHGVQRNPQKALQMHIKLAEDGYDYSQLRAGLMFAHANGCDRSDIDQSIKYLKMFAEHDPIRASSEISKVLYRNGRHAESIPYLEFLASKGFSGSMHALGELWGNGLDVLHDHEKSRYYFQLAANEDHPEASYSLGYIYKTGYFVEKNLSKALKHLVHASELGHPLAQMEAGEMYLEQGDLSSARRYLKMSVIPRAKTLLAQIEEKDAP